MSNDHPHDPELERLLESSLSHHSSSTEFATGNLDDVFRRVDRRRNRRRSVAVVGSLALVGAGVVGFAALAGTGGDTTSTADGPPVSGVDEWIATTTVAPVAGGAIVGWACEGEIGFDVAVDQTSPPTTTIVTTDQSAVPATGATPITVNESSATRYFSYCTEVTIPGTAEQPIPTTTWVERHVWYVVQPGDSLSELADRYGVPAAEIAAFNGWTDGIDHPLLANEEILIPVVDGAILPTSTLPPPLATTTTSIPSVGGHIDQEQIYVARDGDGPGSIAAMFGVDIEVLVNYNATEENNFEPSFDPGDVVRIPPGALPAPTTTTSTTTPS